MFGALIFTFLKFAGPPGMHFKLTEGWTTTLNIYSQVGLVTLVTLVGLVSKNGILIVEFANVQQALGMSKLDAIREAASTRLRPILMTTVATVAGHFPLTLVTGAVAVARNSIGVVLVGGMTIGTLFTLFVVPSLYVLISKDHREKAVSAGNDAGAGFDAGKSGERESAFAHARPEVAAPWSRRESREHNRARPLVAQATPVTYDDSMRLQRSGRIPPLLAVIALVGCGSADAVSGAGAGAGAGADSSADSSADSGAGTESGAATSDDASAGSDAGGVLPSGRTFPDSSATIAILADQLPTMNAAQTQFAATHYVGTEKQLLPATHALRAINPNFLVLHYHLSMWQSAPGVDFIVPAVADGGADGVTWGNDYPTVTTNEDWFWHDAQNTRVASSADGKLLMNVSVAAFQSYWARSLADQVTAGEYDAIFFDSASPALLQGECGTADPRLAGAAARDTSFSALGNATWIHAWEAWMGALNTTLAAEGIPLIPNTSAFVTGWDNTNYGLTAGIFAEGFASRSFAPSDWQASTNALLTLAAADKIMILQNYLSTPTDVATRLYYLANYLLVKGRHTYLDYFAAGPMEWYPEWTVDLGAPTTAVPVNVASLANGGVYRRDFARGSVLVNPSSSPVTVMLGATFHRVVPAGGGAVDGSGTAPGTLGSADVTAITVAPTTGEILLR